MNRTWLFAALSVGGTLAVVAFYAWAHGFHSGFSHYAGDIGPRYRIREFGPHLLWVQLAALTCLTFDCRSRDVRDGIAEVLDAKPFDVLALLCGRLLGLVVIAWIPLLVAAALVQGWGSLARSIDWWMGDPIEPVSLTMFLFVDAIPALTFWCALVMLLATLLRKRLVVLVVALALLGAHVGTATLLPVVWLPVVSFVGDHGRLASDLAAEPADLETLVLRCVSLALAAAFLLICARQSPGRGNARGRTSLGLGFAIVACGGWVAVAAERVADEELRREWLAAHRAAKSVTADLQRVSGEIRLAPGESLEVALEMILATAGPHVVLAFNPGMNIRKLLVDDRSADYRFDEGLLVVELPRGRSVERVTVSLRADGTPDPDFAYLDSAAEWRERRASHRLHRFGTRGAVFDRDYVALPSAVRWLPAIGGNVERSGRADFFHLDLAVTAPEHWLVAGPGRRHTNSDGRQLFRPAAPVREAALFAAAFERRAFRVLGIDFELLLHPDHRRNAVFFAPAVDAIEGELKALFAGAKSLGIPYSLAALSIVEVPATLRDYGGGWRMPLALPTPGIWLLKENGWPMAHFQRRYPPYTVIDGTVADEMVIDLDVFLANAHGAANLHDGVAGGLLATTAAVGRGAASLDFVLRRLVALLLTDLPTQPAASAHRFDFDERFGAMLGDVVAGIEDGNYQRLVERLGPREIAESAWQRASVSALADLPVGRASSSSGALDVRGEAAARLLFDVMGRERAAGFVRGLRDRGVFTAEDVHVVGAGLGMPPLSDWFDNARLPGFVASPAVVRRLADERGEPAGYHVTMHVRNGESVPGWCQLALHWRFFPLADPVRVPAGTSVEFGIVTDNEPSSLWLHSYASRNRRPVQLAVREGTDDVTVDTPPFVGARPSRWIPPDPGIVVDDLAAEFRAADEVVRSAVEASGWTRRWIPSSWGKYRRTVLQAPAGDGSRAVVFTSRLPATGRWRLDYHMPARVPVGTVHMTLATDLGAMGVEFDGAEAGPGWYHVGDYDLAASEVTVSVWDRTTGAVVVADAIRWRRAVARASSPGRHTAAPWSRSYEIN